MTYVFCSGASNLEELQQKLSSTLMIRREKSEVLTQLPPKQRQRVLFELKDSDIKRVNFYSQLLASSVIMHAFS